MRLANDWVRNQYYVGEYSGAVAIYQGVSQELGPIRLAELDSVADGLPVDALPALYRDQVHDTIVATDRSDAELKVEELRYYACRVHLPQPAPASTPTPAPTPPAEPTASAAPTEVTVTDDVDEAAAEGPTVNPTTGPQRTPDPESTPEPSEPDEPTDEPQEPIVEPTPDFPGLVCEEVR